MKKIYSTSSFTDKKGNTIISENQPLGVIRVCPEPCCEAIYHNCNPKIKHCIDCGGGTRKINESTYWKKFSNSFFQYDQSTMQFFRPKKQTNEKTTNRKRTSSVN